MGLESNDKTRAGRQRSEEKSVMDKLGVKSGQRVVILGVTDDQLAKDLAARGAEVSAGRMKPGADVVFLGAVRLCERGSST